MRRTGSYFILGESIIFVLKNNFQVQIQKQSNKFNVLIFTAHLREREAVLDLQQQILELSTKSIYSVYLMTVVYCEVLALYFLIEVNTASVKVGRSSTLLQLRFNMGSTFVVKL